MAFFCKLFALSLVIVVVSRPDHHYQQHRAQYIGYYGHGSNPYAHTVYAHSSTHHSPYENHGHHNLHALHNKIDGTEKERRMMDTAATGYYGHKHQHSHVANPHHHQPKHEPGEDFYDYTAKAEEWREALREVNLIRASLGWNHLEWSESLANKVPESAFDEDHHSFPPTVISRPSDYSEMNLVQGVRQLVNNMLYENHIQCNQQSGTCKAKIESADQEYPWAFVDTHAKQIGCRARLHIIKKGVLHLEVACKTNVHTSAQSHLFNLHRHIKNQQLLEILKKREDSSSSSSSQMEDAIMNLSLEGEHEGHENQHHHQNATLHIKQPHHSDKTSHNSHLPSYHELHKHHQKQHEKTSSSFPSSSSSSGSSETKQEHAHSQDHKNKLEPNFAVPNRAKAKKHTHYSSGLSSSSSSSSSYSSEESKEHGKTKTHGTGKHTEHTNKHARY